MVQEMELISYVRLPMANNGSDEQLQCNPTMHFISSKKFLPLLRVLLLLGLLFAGLLTLIFYMLVERSQLQLKPLTSSHDTAFAEGGADYRTAQLQEVKGEREEGENKADHQLTYWADTDICIDRIYEEFNFENMSRFANSWQIDFPLTYDHDMKPMLEVIVMPHSHLDPGFVETYEDYYWSKTSSILSNAHKYLSAFDDMTFQLAEMCYLELWWRNHEPAEREAFTKVVENGQLEILTGGWVMTDEANTHYYAMIMQLIEGHEWLRNHMPNVTPVSHWNIDTFGFSPTWTYLLGLAGIKQGSCRRAHLAVKAHLAARQQMEFRWRQSWDGDSNATDFLIHLHPSAGVHIPQACGPDPEVGCQFDFEHIGEICLADFEGKVLAINEDNVAERADMIADQFRKKAQIYKGNVIFVPWGEDFRYAAEQEWINQHDNLRALFDHINSHSESYNMQVRFGTLTQYFDLKRERLSNGTETAEIKGDESDASKISEPAINPLPTLSGDFLTYADSSHTYWSGLFTTRPFHKHLDRTLQHYLRTADILFTAALNRRRVGDEEDPSPTKGLLNLYPRLVVARRALGLFQHHDAVTGTCRAAVIRDYAARLLEAVNSSLAVIAQTTSILLGQDSPSANSSSEQLPTSDEEFVDEALPRQRVILPESELILFNPLSFERDEVVCIVVPAPPEKQQGTTVLVHEHPVVWSPHKAEGKRRAGGWAPLQHQQIQPVVIVEDNLLTLASDRVQLCFLAKLPAMGFRRYYVDYPEKEAHAGNTREATNGSQGSRQTALAVRLFSKKVKFEADSSAKNLFSFEPTTNTTEGYFTMANERIALSVDARTGLLLQLKKTSRGEGVKEQQPSDDNNDDDDAMKVELSFEHYSLGLEPTYGFTSGHYLFVPSGPAQAIPNMADNAFVLIDGPLRKTLIVKLATPNHLVHTLELDAHRDAATIRNLIDISSLEDVEVAMRLKASPDLQDFYTELNAFQFSRRRRHFDKMPLQAHFFPMPGGAFIQNRRHRLTLLGRQALGTASLEPGWLEVMLDRRSSHDDGRHIEEGVLDNRLTRSEFTLILESFSSGSGNSHQWKDAADTAFHSLNSFRSSLRLHYPVVVQFVRRKQLLFFKTVPPELLPLMGEHVLPCDVHLVALRTLSNATNYGEAVLPPEERQLVDFASLITEPKHSAALIMHRTGVEGGLPSRLEECGAQDGNNAPKRSVAFNSVFGNNSILHPRKVAEASLTLLRVAEYGEVGGNVSELRLKPMEVRTWQIDF